MQPADLLDLTQARQRSRRVARQGLERAQIDAARIERQTAKPPAESPALHRSPAARRSGPECPIRPRRLDRTGGPRPNQKRRPRGPHAPRRPEYLPRPWIARSNSTTRAMLPSRPRRPDRASGVGRRTRSSPGRIPAASRIAALNPASSRSYRRLDARSRSGRTRRAGRERLPGRGSVPRSGARESLMSGRALRSCG